MVGTTAGVGKIGVAAWVAGVKNAKTLEPLLIEDETWMSGLDCKISGAATESFEGAGSSMPSERRVV